MADRRRESGAGAMAKTSIATAVVLLVIGAADPEAARFAAWAACGAATLLLYRAVRR